MKTTVQTKRKYISLTMPNERHWDNISPDQASLKRAHCNSPTTFFFQVTLPTLMKTSNTLSKVAKYTKL